MSENQSEFSAEKSNRRSRLAFLKATRRQLYWALATGTLASLVTIACFWMILSQSADLISLSPAPSEEKLKLIQELRGLLLVTMFGASFLSLLVAGIVTFALLSRFFGPLQRISEQLTLVQREQQLPEFNARSDDDVFPLVEALNSLKGKFPQFPEHPNDKPRKTS